MQTTYYAVKAIEDHKFDAVRKSAPKRKDRVQKAEKVQATWTARATRPVVNPS